jgi:hypothetical protein
MRLHICLEIAKDTLWIAKRGTQSHRLCVIPSFARRTWWDPGFCAICVENHLTSEDNKAVVDLRWNSKFH